MEAGRNLLSSPPFFPPLKPQLRNSPLPSSVTMLHELAAPAVTSVPTTSMTRHFPASVLLQEQRDNIRSLLHIREEKTIEATLDRTEMENDASLIQNKKEFGSDQYLKDFERQLLHCPGLWYLLPSLESGEKPVLSMNMQSMEAEPDKVLQVKASDVLALAKKAVLASKQAVSLAEETNSAGHDSDEIAPGLEPKKLSLPDREITVRSTRLMERQSKKRRGPKLKVLSHEPACLRMTDRPNKINQVIDPNDPLSLFLSGSETRKLLTATEETELFIHVQELIRLEEVKQRLQCQFAREPTLVEWAEAVGMSCGTLQSHLHSGKRSREKMIHANFRLVVHVAKNYQGKGLNLQDLLQEGSKGLIKSLEKFKPQAGCRISTYAYWWIRQSVRKAIFQNSRTIRLPENVYNTLRQVKSAKELFIREGHQPTNEDLAKQVGISVDKLESLLAATRIPISMQQPIWSYQATTYQEVTADPEVATPEDCVEKNIMRRHVRNLVSVLPPKEKRIIRLRYGIEDGEPKTLEQIGTIFGLSKERIRQLESRALGKLKKCSSSHGLEAYTNLLT